MNFSDISELVSGNLGIEAIASTFQMLLWGLVMAKAKTGFSAAATKNLGSVKSSQGKMVGIGILICIAGLAKLNADNHYIDNFVDTVKTQSANMGISLMSTPNQPQQGVAPTYESIMN